MSTNTPKYIAIEGPIGVGKTTLCRRLAEKFNYDLLLEAPSENPFLSRFYSNPRQYAFQTQVQFLLHRAEQLRSLKQEDLFEQVKVADFLIDKDRLFAQLNLDHDEFELYLKIYKHLTIDAPIPDLVIYLQAPVETLLQRIRKRNIACEQSITPSYLNRINEAYTRFFHFYNGSPLLIINASEIDVINNERDFLELVTRIQSNITGRQYFNIKATVG